MQYRDSYTRIISALVECSRDYPQRVRMLVNAYTALDIPRTASAYLAGAALRTLTQGE